MFLLLHNKTLLKNLKILVIKALYLANISQNAPIHRYQQRKKISWVLQSTQYVTLRIQTDVSFLAALP